MFPRPAHREVPSPRPAAGRPSLVAAAALLALAAMTARAGGTLDLPVADADGQPIDVGVLVLGHSTSAAGDWPGKLARVLNADPLDGRNYVVMRAITNGDGGFLWSQLRFDPSDPQYDRVLSSAAGQYCEDGSGTRWSCRRLRLERGLTGIDPAPPECAPPNGACVPPLIASCVWHEGGQRFEELDADWTACWSRMDVRLTLVQDTTNRSLALDDTDGDGSVDDGDAFLASDIAPPGRPCGGGAGVIGPWLDWDCDGTIGPGDASAARYAEWMRNLAQDLLDAFGSGADHVFFSQKPLEMVACPYYPGEPCSFHGLRVPTASRPLDHFDLPTVYWEYRGLETLFEQPDLDARIHRATPRNILRMWERSAQCRDSGIPAGDWTVPPSAGRPASVAADDGENDALDAAFVGCLAADHVHHNESGGWLMADVWYEGLRPYLASVLVPPSPAGDASLGGPLRVTGFDAGGRVAIEFEPACRAIDHAVHVGALAGVALHAYDRTECGLGVSGAATFDVGPGNRFFVVAGRDGYAEGSLGADSFGREHPEPMASGPCFLPQRLGGTCP